MSLLTLSDFTPLRRARAAAPSLSLSLRRGELTVLVGPNGCGKSTHLAALSGGLPYSGSARLSESELSSLSPRERARLVSLAPQFPTRPHLPLSSALAMARVPYLSLGARLAEDDREAIASAVSLCGVESYLERTLDTLSGGEL
jgi:iron complex transport system ATP-binding protein